MINNPNESPDAQKKSQRSIKPRIRSRSSWGVVLISFSCVLIIFSLADLGYVLHNNIRPISSGAQPTSTSSSQNRVAKRVVQATPTATPTPQDTQIASQVDSLLASRVAKQQFEGSVLIAKNGQIVLSKGYGMADWQNNVSIAPSTRFFLGSTTKEFTAMATLILQERGKLKITDSLCKYVANCPAAWRPVTIRELLTHTSGIPQLADAQLSGASPEAWMASYANTSLAFAAGSHYDYCSVCYQILAYVVEQAAGVPYSTFVPEAIFEPLGMKNTGFDIRALKTGNHADGYAQWKVPAVSLSWDYHNAPRWSFLFGSGLLTSTSEDLYKWDQALYTTRLVSQKTLDAAFTPYYTAQYPGSSYGYGWFIAKSPVAQHRLIWHDGVIDGFRTYIGRYVDDHVTIIFLSNLATVDERGLGKTLEKIVFGES